MIKIKLDTVTDKIEFKQRLNPNSTTKKLQVKGRVLY